MDPSNEPNDQGVNASNDVNQSYMQYASALVSQYSAQLMGIALSSLLAISTGFFNNITTSILSKINGTVTSNADSVYLSGLMSAVSIWSQLYGNGISAVTPNSSASGWTNFYIGFSGVSGILSSFNPAQLGISGSANINTAIAWYSQNIGKINSLLQIFSGASSAVQCTGFFAQSGSTYYVMLPAGDDYGWLSFNPTSSYVMKLGGNNALNLILQGSSCQILETIDVVVVSPTAQYTESDMTNKYTFNFANSIATSATATTVPTASLVSFSYFNQFLGLTMTIYSNTTPGSGSVVTILDANGMGIGISQSKNITFVSN